MAPKGLVMMTIRELLNRIRWDPGFAQASFTIGYYDRVEDRIVLVPHRRLRFPPDERFVFELGDEFGQVLRVPLHRVREVYRNGELIWRRPVR